MKKRNFTPIIPDRKRDQLFEEYRAKRNLLQDLTTLENLLEKLGCDYGEEISEDNKLFDKSLFIACRELDDVYNGIVKRGNEILKELKLI